MRIESPQQKFRFRGYMNFRNLVLFLALPAMLLAQEFRGTISGVISDRSGAVIPNVKVTVTEVQTNTRLTVTTEAGGRYTAPFLSPGDYDITAQLQGFREAV